MDSIIAFLIDWGYLGMLLSAFLAGSFFPFSSEAVMLGLLAAGLKPWPLILYATVGNVLGGLFNYAIGHMGRMDWIEKYLHVKPASLQKAQRFMAGRGAWMGFFAFLPIIGSAITIVLGLMRSNLLISTVSITAGKFARYVILAFSAITLTSCSFSSPKTSQQITVSIEPLRYFTEQIAGNRYKVVTMVPGGMSPETYEPTAQQMMALNESTLYIKVGQIGFERTWMSKLKANAPHTRIVDTSVGITPVKTLNGIIDPHTWMSCRNARQIAYNIFNALKQTNAKDSTYYRANLNKLLTKINATDQEVNKLLAGKTKAFLIYHPILTYFAHDYRLTQIPIEEEGREPSANQLQSIIRLAKQQKIKTLYIQKQFNNRNTEIVSKDLNLPSTAIDPLNYHWNQQMITIAKALK